MTQNQHGPIIKMLFAAYPQVQVSDATVAVYLRLLQDIPAADLRVVVERCIAESKFLPTVAELRAQQRTLNPRSTVAAQWHAFQSGPVLLPDDALVIERIGGNVEIAGLLAWTRDEVTA